MASSNSKLPIFIASAIGALGAVYIVSPKTELSGKGKPASAPTEGRSQSAKDGKTSDGSASVSSPHPALHHGGSSPSDREGPTVAGQTGSSRKSHSAEHDVKTQDNPSGQAGQGLAQMRERKMEGKGLPSPQGGDTPAQATPAQKGYGEAQTQRDSGPNQSDTPKNKQSGGGWSSWFGGK
ncbi:uncharacterized protein IL334_004374 [Kwoniella shivajii]|uniref:Uncharacterized protein n=1 Tax=Kwoniella shivajii TaxID=564305 RepID=A0ABZ1D062_9TREE|nr:hypothetical protein IL334_004374 [Kwoniella shivajii]